MIETLHGIAALCFILAVMLLLLHIFGKKLKFPERTMRVLEIHSLILVIICIVSLLAASIFGK